MDEHTLKVIGALSLFASTLPLLTGHPEADDTPVRGPAVHRIPIVLPPSSGAEKIVSDQPTIKQFTAQRYSAILNTAGNKHGDKFWLRAQMNTECFGGAPAGA